MRQSRTAGDGGSFRGRDLLIANNLHRWLRFVEDGRVRWMDKRDGREYTAERPPDRHTRRGPRRALHTAAPLPAAEMLARRSCAALGIDWAAQQARGFRSVAEPQLLLAAGRDHHQRRLWLAPEACRAWLRMRAAAAAEGIALVAISGFRAIAWQQRLLAQKQARGQALTQILMVNAAPGFSEHHGGCALDLATPDDPALEERFEHTTAFAWLRRRAAAFGFHLSFPRDNRFGVLYEPWHWCFQRR